MSNKNEYTTPLEELGNIIYFTWFILDFIVAKESKLHHCQSQSWVILGFPFIIFLFGKLTFNMAAHHTPDDRCSLSLFPPQVGLRRL